MPSAALAARPAIDMTDPSPEQIATEDAVDVALMARIGQGDHQAFKLLIERHQNAVIGTVAKMLNDFTEAEDIAQQVFLRIWRHAKRYRHEAKFTTYLFTITRNLVFNETRRRGRRKQVSMEEREESVNFQVAGDPAEQPDAAILQGELQTAVDAAIAALPETQRLAVVLRRYEQMPYEEMAGVLNLTVPAIKSLLFRARATLREKLEKFMES